MNRRLCETHVESQSEKVVHSCRSHHGRSQVAVGRDRSQVAVTDLDQW